MDVFEGMHAPISAAADKQGLLRFEAFDLEANSEHDILDDVCFELLMRISWSGKNRKLFKAVATQGGVAVFEQPPSSMAWLEPETFSASKPSTDTWHGWMHASAACLLQNLGVSLQTTHASSM